MRIARILLAVIPAALLAVGCSSTPSLAESDLESEVGKGIATQMGVPPQDVTVTCPGDLEASVGSTLTCSVTTAQDGADVLITVTSVDGTDVAFDWKIVS